MLLNESEPPGSEGIKERRDVAIERFGTAIRFYPPDTKPWNWRYELARQLQTKMTGSTNAERAKLKKDALDQLNQAMKDAPTAERDQLVAPLQKLIQGMK